MRLSALSIDEKFQNGPELQRWGGTDKLGISQIEQDLALCAEKYPELICRSTACQFITRDIVAMFEFSIEDERIAKVNERHYKIVDASSISSDDLRASNSTHGISYRIQT